MSASAQVQRKSPTAGSLATRCRWDRINGNDYWLRPPTACSISTMTDLSEFPGRPGELHFQLPAIGRGLFGSATAKLGLFMSRENLLCSAFRGLSLSTGTLQLWSLIGCRAAYGLDSLTVESPI